MFAIYDIQGRRFRDTLENLRKVEKINDGGRARSSDKTYEGEQRPTPGTTRAESGGVPVSNNAVHAYREMLRLNRREPIFHASQLMRYPVSTVIMDMGILAAQRYFHQQGLRQMPVLSAEQRIVGMLSVEDLMQYIVIDDGHVRYVEGKRVADAMSQHVITADPVSDVRRIAQAMLEYHLHSVPIVDEMDTLIGIVARGDILRAVMNDPPLNMWS
ncbi:MAG: CBS domain-containing protein [Gammaproteobacteria bacterium]|nr:CBS domain-containing protein [Gammaproteobacteria bacterium]